MNAQTRRQIMERLKAERPEPESELNHKNAFELLIAVMLSAQATDKSVNLATPALFAAMPDAATMAQKTPEEIEPFIKTIGLYRNKAKHAVGIAKALLERFDGEVPQTLKELMSLPGVGEKTGKVVLNVAFNKPFIPVDTHIFRVCQRTGLVQAKTANECSDKLEKLLPEEFRLGAHHWILLHGRYCCTARKPQCSKCPISDLCRWPEKELS